MKKNKLLEFYNKIKENGMNVSVIRLLRNCSDKDLDIVMSSPYPKVMMDIVINYEFKLLSVKEQEEIINIINNAKTEEIANGIYRVVASRITISSGLITKIAKIINESSIEASLYVIDLALTNNVLINPNLLEIMKIIGSSTKEYQAKTSTDIAKSIEVLLHQDVLEIIEIASKTEGETKSKLVNTIAKNRDVLSFDLAVELITLASKIDITEDQAELIILVASNKLLEKNKRSVEYIVRMLESKNEIVNIYNHAQTEIRLLKQFESKLKTDDTFFWNLYKKNPEEVIASIKDEENEEITPYTKIRAK